MHYEKLSTALLIVLLLSVSFNTSARPKKDNLDSAFKYGWSQAASMIFFGTIAEVDYRDDPRNRSPHVDVLVRIDSLQRGEAESGMVRIRIEDELQTYNWQGQRSRVGEQGFWFIHRVRQYEGGTQRGHLIRYVDEAEMQEDPQFLAELMNYVIRDTIDQSIRPNILNILSGKPDEQESATIRLELNYNEAGALEDINILERSGNLLYDDHVFDTVMQVHRRIRVPGQVKMTEIEVSRQQL